MKKISSSSPYKLVHSDRMQRTVSFVEKLIKPSDKILDLGPENPLSRIFIDKGYDVQNTPENIDLDFDYQVVKQTGIDVVTAFEILEHLVSPFPLLNSINAKKLIASIPLRLWFSESYWNEKDPLDRHYHEFEPRQFHMLLEKAGWKVKKSEKWKHGVGKIGIRPLLRKITPRYYIVYCEKS